MIAIKAARKFIESHPTDPDAAILADLVLALENESVFSLGTLYRLRPDQFELAMSILNDWRIDRYYIGKAKLFDISWQHRELRKPDAPPEGQ
ncbi:MAG TPA: hypothetical protein VHA82_03645 [Ramlibacter sp.]|uniref:hypothetical protein n=1 Tax=Ramlibacter sp. TaxID=1917967 RepID=UPI002C2D6977|nr:hypothetical protein [Ramlibacter sp.]HVZ42882.1 hypothetical protein [Ramlibacter sp.]